MGRSDMVRFMGIYGQEVLSSYPKTMREQVHRMRQQHPGWAKYDLRGTTPRGKEKTTSHPESIGRYLQEQWVGYQHQH